MKSTEKLTMPKAGCALIGGTMPPTDGAAPGAPGAPGAAPAYRDRKQRLDHHKLLHVLTTFVTKYKFSLCLVRKNVNVCFKLQLMSLRQNVQL